MHLDIGCEYVYTLAGGWTGRNLKLFHKYHKFFLAYFHVKFMNWKIFIYFTNLPLCQRAPFSRMVGKNVSACKKCAAKPHHSLSTISISENLDLRTQLFFSLRIFFPFFWSLLPLTEFFLCWFLIRLFDINSIRIQDIWCKRSTCLRFGFSKKPIKFSLVVIIDLIRPKKVSKECNFCFRNLIFPA